MQQISARGNFVIVRVKTWFDERTISVHRGNGLLTPNARKVILVDNKGKSSRRRRQVKRLSMASVLAPRL